MRIAVATDDARGLDAVLSYHFGRCPYYILVDVEGKEIKRARSVANPFYAEHGQPGQVPSFINSQGAQVIIAGGMGYRAMQSFQEFGIEPITKVSGKAKDVVEAYLDEKIQGAKPCDESQTHQEGKEVNPPTGEFEGNELSRLKEEIAALRRQLAESQERLAKLERGKEEN